ncbi:MAG TPA: hypothetical protein PL048_00500 [Leptospiraceae bacterium]|nr:hypothetical protein [Leptospiraceae bacterium]HMY66558.1 hypothetical protein [Leptospiraceae bacterium]HMZ57222.1 hypothetical protein [Leptospiraceae bacterium]HNF14641.1 hypothetical protein [Leptospiraceae bacterium]HNF23638.1 hypothetical protein [Leptospiraceae bacterium]
MKILILYILSVLFFQISISAQKTEPSVTYIMPIYKNLPLSLKNPSEYCLEDEKLYTGSEFRAGELNIFSADEKKPLKADFRFAVIVGKLKKDMNSKLKFKSECPAGYGEMESSQQLRSDWVSKETGFTIGRSSRDIMKEISYIEVQKISEYKGFELRRTKKYGYSSVYFKNSLSTEIPELTITAHYESKGKGKPYPDYRNKTYTNVQKGDKIFFEIPHKYAKEKEDPSDKSVSFHLHSVSATAVTPDIKISLEIIKDYDE